MAAKQTKRDDETITIKLNKKKLGIILSIALVFIGLIIISLLMPTKEVVYPKPETVEWARSRGMTAL